MAEPAPVTMNKHVRRGLILTLFIAVIAAAITFYIDGVRPNLSPKRLGTVDDGKVYRSGQLTPAAYHEVHERYGIRTIIDLGSYVHNDPVGERRNQRTAEALGAKRFVLPLFGDSTGNPNYYIQALRLAIDPANQPVLIHCGAGTERTGLLCILYKNMQKGVSFEDGLAEAIRYGHNPTKTPELKQMLAKYGEAIIDHVRRGGQIDTPGIPALADPLPGSPLDHPAPLK